MAILYVDSDVGYAKEAARYLTGMGAIIQIASGWDEAVSALNADPIPEYLGGGKYAGLGAFRSYLMDYVLNDRTRDINGFDLARLIRALESQRKIASCPIIFYTSERLGPLSSAAESMRMTNIRFLSKMAPLDQVADILRG